MTLLRDFPTCLSNFWLSIFMLKVFLTRSFSRTLCFRLLFCSCAFCTSIETVKHTHTTVCVGLVFRMLSIKFNALATFHSIYQNRRCESGFRADGLQTHSIHLPIPHWKMNKLTDKLRFTFYFSTRKLNALAKPHLTEHWTISPEMNKHNSSDCLKEPEAFGFALT